MISPSVGRQQWYRNKWVGIGAVILAAALCVLLYVSSRFQPVSSKSASIRYIDVRPGQSAEMVAKTLHQHHIIRSAWAFVMLSRYEGLATHLTAGVYGLSPRQSLRSIITQMRKGHVAVTKVTIPEGYTVRQITARLVAAHIGTSAQYRQLEQSPLPGMPKPAPGVRDPLEGYLYPATYSFPHGISAKGALTLMWDTFQSRVMQGLYGKSHTRMTLVQWVTLASIVQAECQKPSQSADVAAVFMNRLTLHMPFQSDATVRYAWGRLPPGGLVPADLSLASPYNTYLHKGFPPGPIDNPGTATLEAAMHPAPVSYLYFVSLRSGRLLFSTTYQRHLANIVYAKNHPNA